MSVSRTVLRPFLVSLALAIVILPRVSAADDHDAGIWFVNQFRAPLGERLSLHGMLQNRWNDDIGDYERTVVRPWVSYSWPEGTHLAVGYDLHEFESPDRHEHRAWQRIAYQHPVDRFTLLAHAWLEERFFQNADDVALRLRLNWGAATELGRDFGLLLRNELFFDLNGTSRIRNAGLGENQLVLALGRKLPGNLLFEVGYLQQYVDRRGGDDLYNHFVMTGFSWRAPQLADWL